MASRQKFARLELSEPSQSSMPNLYDDPGQLSSASPTPPLPKSTAPKRGRKSTKRSQGSGAANLIPVPTQHNDNAQRQHTKHISGARRRLGITPEQMRGVPRISHILEHADGGMATVIAALRLCDDADAGKFVDCYDSLSDTDLAYLSVEE